MLFDGRVKLNLDASDFAPVFHVNLLHHGSATGSAPARRRTAKSCCTLIILIYIPPENESDPSKRDLVARSRI
jgi:hypothetical protein